jgi:hypothetical protein
MGKGAFSAPSPRSTPKAGLGFLGKQKNLSRPRVGLLTSPGRWQNIRGVGLLGLGHGQCGRRPKQHIWAGGPQDPLPGLRHSLERRQITLRRQPPVDRGWTSAIGKCRVGRIQKRSCGRRCPQRESGRRDAPLVAAGVHKPRWRRPNSSGARPIGASGSARGVAVS